MAVVTALQVDKRGRQRVKLYLDGAFAMELPLLQAAQLQTGQCLSQCEVDALAEARSFQSAYDKALRYLSYRPRSIEETRRYLLGKELAAPIVASVIERLCQADYLDDRAFARYWLENRNRFKPRGPRALRYELWQKGVENRIIDAVLLGLDAAEAARRAAQNQLHRYHGCSRQLFRRKMSDLLYRRGFDSGTINAVVAQMQQELDESEEGYFGQDEAERHHWLES